MFRVASDSHWSLSTRQRNDRKADFRCGANPQQKVNVLNIPAEDFESIVRIFAAGFLRLRARRKQENQLANPPAQSVHGDEVNSVETREKHGDPDAERD